MAKTGLISVISYDKGSVLNGIRKAASVIGSTMGPLGKGVFMQHIQKIEDERNPTGVVRAIKDGATVAKHLAFTVPEEDYGRSLLVQGCEATRKRAGDATTCTAVLTAAICDNLPDGNPHMIKRGIRQAVADVCDMLMERSIPVGDDMLDSIAAIAANGDPIGPKVAGLVKKVGRDGHIRVKSSANLETTVEHMDGLYMDYGLGSAYFMNEKDRLEVDHCHVIIMDFEFSDFERQLGRKGKNLGPIGHWAQNLRGEKNEPLVIFCRGMKDSALKTVVSFKMGGAPVHVVCLPGQSWEKAALMDDISLVTGAPVFSKAHGKSINDVYDKIEGAYGTAEGIYATMERTVISHSVDISGRVQELNDMVSAENDEAKKTLLMSRLAALSGGVGTIHIGGAIPAEIERDRDTADDVMRSCFAAMKHGAVPGGGNALAWASTNLSVPDGGGDFVSGYMAVISSCVAPLNRIFHNGHLEQPSVKSNWGVGTDIHTLEEIDLVQNGIIDPTLAICEALTNASSVAVQLLECDTIIYYDTIILE